MPGGFDVTEPSRSRVPDPVHGQREPVGDDVKLAVTVTCAPAW